MTAADLNKALQLNRLTAFIEGQAEAPVAIAGQLTADGVYLLPGETPPDSAALTEALAFAHHLADILSSAQVYESSDTDTPYVPFVLPHAFSPAALAEQVPSWLGLLALPEGQAVVDIDESSFRAAEKLAVHEQDEDVDDYYEPEEVEAIHAAAEFFNAFPDRRLVQLTAGYVAILLLDLAQLPGGFWAGVATLRIDT
ncbi:hypothetical protein GO986_03805 [Deinococcus sp. HMF7620]|uniref:Uncharacterized protein n=1 Tax=Deinococcus arboris TaxID=2682977 RepID=A0A7C9I8Z3_9DEIO|nr:hypothetical protein [Deinococcus arboris]MVN85886.1 hypothetical protein [Deinococcus arboris]